MRRYSLMLLVALLAIVLGLGAVACGSGDTAGGKTPQEAVTAALDTLQSSTSQSGSYEISLTVQADESSQSDPMSQALFGQPIVITGDFAEQQDPVAAEFSLSLNLMGMAVNAGVKALDENVWLNVMGQWYEVPAEDLQTDGEAMSAEALASLQQALDTQGIDPTSWYTELTVVGTESLDGTDVSHLTGTLDVQKMLTDVVALLQSPELATLMGDATGAASDTGVSLPDEAETAELQAMLEEMFKSATLDLWIADSDSSLRQVVLAAEIAMPADLGETGMTGASIKVTVNLDAPDQAVTVEAPASAKPLSELETDLQSNPLLSGLGSLLGSGSDLGSILGE